MSGGGSSSAAAPVPSGSSSLAAGAQAEDAQRSSGLLFELNVNQQSSNAHAGPHAVVAATDEALRLVARLRKARRELVAAVTEFAAQTTPAARQLEQAQLGQLQLQAQTQGPGLALGQAPGQLQGLGPGQTLPGGAPGGGLAAMVVGAPQLPVVGAGGGGTSSGEVHGSKTALPSVQQTEVARKRSEARSTAQNRVTECFTTIKRLKVLRPILDRAINALKYNSAILDSGAVPKTLPPAMTPAAAALLLQGSSRDGGLETFAEVDGSAGDTSTAVSGGDGAAMLPKRRRTSSGHDALAAPGVDVLSLRAGQTVVRTDIVTLERVVKVWNTKFRNVNAVGKALVAQLCHRSVQEDMPAYLRCGVHGVMEVFFELIPDLDDMVAGKGALPHVSIGAVSVLGLHETPAVRTRSVRVEGETSKRHVLDSSPMIGSSTAVFNKLEVVVSCVLRRMLLSSRPEETQTSFFASLFLWLAGYKDLFLRTCTKCGKIFEPQEKSRFSLPSDLLPPVIRTVFQHGSPNTAPQAYHYPGCMPISLRDDFERMSTY